MLHPLPASLVQRMVLKLSGAACLLAWAGTILYALLFSHSVAPRFFLFALGWIIFLCVIVWLAFVAPYLGWAGLSRTPSQQRLVRHVRFLALFITGVSALWLFVASYVGPYRLFYSMHWWVQGLIVIGGVAAIVWRFASASQLTTQDNLAQSVRNQERRADLLAGLGALARSDWLKDSPHLAEAARLRACLLWWQEEIETAMPPHGPQLAKDSWSLYLHHARLELSHLIEVSQQDMVSQEALAATERRVLDDLDRLAQVSGRGLG